MLTFKNNTFLLNIFTHLILFFFLPLFFIINYIINYYHPIQVIFQHLIPISLFIAAILSLKLFIQNLGLNKNLNLVLAINLYTISLLILICYYSFVHFGLESWGRVITEEFIISYAKQIPALLSTLDISISLVIIIFIVIYLVITIFNYFFIRYFNWDLNYKKSPKLFNYLILSIFFLTSYKFTDYIQTNHKNIDVEPIYLTMHSGKEKTQNHNANQGSIINSEINRLENNSRKNYSANDKAKRKNLIVLMVDGLRPDHMSVYGYPRNTTPYLKMLREQNHLKRITGLRSTCGETACAHASFFGSRFIKNLPDNLFTLQEVLKKHQYTNNFIISGDHINFHNIRDIYGDIDNYFDGSMQEKYYFNDDNLIIDKTRALADWNGKPQAFHYHILSNHIMGRKFDGFNKFTPSENYAFQKKNNLIIGKDSLKLQFTNFYDNGILQTDFVIKTLLNILKEKNYLNNALVIITSDHGESLGEHNLFMHTNSVQEELLRIPLLIIPFGYQSKIQDNNKLTSIIDLAPTILMEFDMQIPATWSGTPIQKKEYRDISFFQMRSFEGFYDVDGDIVWKYWQDKNSLEEFIFNINKDPKERNNLLLKTSRKKLIKWRKILLSTNKSDIEGS